ncbi:MAG: hypothetical protein HQM11_07875 [SAR324 cluster bacterium]|nr:hypothetical protein [SAR324 cluster bacterium]
MSVPEWTKLYDLDEVAECWEYHNLARSLGISPWGIHADLWQFLAEGADNRLSRFWSQLKPETRKVLKILQKEGEKKWATFMANW